MSEAHADRRWGARGAIAGLVLLGILFTSVYPLRRYFDVRKQVAALHQQSRALDANASTLRTDIARLQTDAEVERLARQRLGYVKKGETAFSMPRDAEPEPTPSVVIGPDPGSTGDPGFVSSWWDAFRHAWRLFH